MRGHDAAGGHPDDRARKARISYHEVAAAAKDEHRLAALVRAPDQRDDLLVAGCLDEARGRPAKTKRGVPGERYLLPDNHVAHLTWSRGRDMRVPIRPADVLVSRRR